jgi:hypothetical protein
MPAEPSIGKHTSPNDYLTNPARGRQGLTNGRACHRARGRFGRKCDHISPSRLAGVVPPPIVSAKRAMVGVHCLTTAAVILRLPAAVARGSVARRMGTNA